MKSGGLGDGSPLVGSRGNGVIDDKSGDGDADEVR